MCNANGEKVESCSRIKDENDRLALGEVKVRRIWREYFEELYDIEPQKQVAVNMYGFDGIRRGNYVGEEPIRRIEVKVRVKKLKNRKAAGKDDITGEVINGRSRDCVI